jgi:hypothetical protein
MKHLIALTLLLFCLKPSAYATNSCTQFLTSDYLLNIDELSFNEEYQSFKNELEDLVKEQSVRKIVTLFNSFQQNYHVRYDVYTSALIEKYPGLKSNTLGFYDAVSYFKKIEMSFISLVEKAILQIPAKKRIHYLRSLNPEQLIKNSLLLDSLFGLDVEKLDQALANDLETNGRLDYSKKQKLFGSEEIWYAPGAGQQSDWSTLIKALDTMELQPNQTVSDLGSGIGRLGLLVGLLWPDVNFIGLEIVSIRVNFANNLARQNGFTNISFKVSDLGDENIVLPDAEHIYMFNPTNPETSELLTNKLVELATRKSIEVHILGGFNSNSFDKSFIRVDYPDPYSNIKTYIKR